jgi:hypothetical protein
MTAPVPDDGQLLSPGDEGFQGGLAGFQGGGHPGLEELAAAALVHDDGERADGGGDSGQFR